MMKKLLAALLAVMMVVSMATVVSAENTTTLTTTVPDASYTLNIPADQEIDFGATSTNIGSVSVTNSAAFAVGKNLKVTVNYSAFTSENVTTTIPFSMKYTTSNSIVGSGTRPEKALASGDAIVFEGRTDGTVDEYVQAHYTYSSGSDYVDMNVYNVIVSSSDWGKALGGEYTATITFTAEVVVE